MKIILFAIYTLVSIGIWGMFMLTNLHIQRFLTYSRFLPIVKRVVTFLLLIGTLFWYWMIYFSHDTEKESKEYYVFPSGPVEDSVTY